MTDPLPAVDEIVQRAADLRERIAVASGSQPVPTVIAVTKAFPVELVRRALAAGLIDLGENYAQELAAKADELGATDLADRGPAPRWHFIGGLQRNKVKLLAGTVSLWQTVDRAALVDEIGKRAPGADVMIQVNTTGEAQKSGCPPADAAALVDRAAEAGLTVRGLMTVGPTDTAIDPRPSFAALRELAERCGVAELSMGMSADYERAIAEGSTMIRVGSVLFGPRPGSAPA